MLSVIEEYLNAKKNYDVIAENVATIVSRKLEEQKLDINDPSNDEKIVATEIEIEKEMGMPDARHKLSIAEEKLLSWGQKKIHELFTKGILKEDFSYLFTSKILRIRNEAIELALKLDDIK